MKEELTLEEAKVRIRALEQNRDNLLEYITDLEEFYRTHIITDGVHTVPINKQLEELMLTLRSIITGKEGEFVIVDV